MGKPATPLPAIALSGVHKRFRRTHAVRDLDVEIPRGTIFGLIGPNGAGKSTALKMMMGLLRPTEGSISVLGRDPLRDPVWVRQRVGYVPELHHIYRWMRVEQVIGFSRAFFEKWSDEKCAVMLELFGLDPRQKVKHLSKGMLGKLALLLAVAHEPELLILDEPMAGLDPMAREEVLDGVLRTIVDREQTVIFSSHTMQDVQRLVDSVGFIYEGRLLLHKPLEKLLASTKRIRATLVNGHVPNRLPDGIVCQRVEGRDWEITVGDFSTAKVELLRSQESVAHVKVIDLGLEDLFKDFVRGQKAVS
jgi:ABC-2 type transport system ATP-binding protein